LRVSGSISGLARITIRAPRRRLDLSVPAQVPLAELLPDVVARAGEAAAADRPAGGWMLRRGDGASLIGDASLAHQGVRDGDVLYLVPRQMAWPEPQYDDVIEEIAEGARQHGQLWGSAATRAFALAGVGLVLVAGLVALLTSDAPGLAGAVAVVAALVLLGSGALVSRALGDGPAGSVAGGGAALYAAAGAILLAAGDQGADQLLVAGSALVLTSIVGAVAVGYGLRLFTAGVVSGLLAAVGAVIAYPLKAPGAAAIICVVLVAGIGLAPLVAVRLGRVPLPVVSASPEIISTERRPARAQLRAAVVRADEILSGTLLGLSIIGLGCVFLLAATTGVAGRLLALLAACSLLLRARLFPAVAARLPLLAAGAAGLVLTVVAALPAVGATAQLIAGVLGVAVMVALLATATMARRSRGVGSPYLARLGDIADVATVVGLAPVAVAVLGLYGWVRGLIG
jgi:type VII secretion integral membrane protein EccD